LNVERELNRIRDEINRVRDPARKQRLLELFDGTCKILDGNLGGSQ